MGLIGLDFWMLEIAFICYFTLKIFGIPVYKHKKYAIYFILIFSTLMKILSLYSRLIDENETRLYKIYSWIAPVGIIIFILLTLLRAYIFCKIKWFMDLKYMLPSKFLLIYGIIGTFICFGASVIPNYYSCNDEDSFEEINIICKVKENENSTTLYYDNFYIYFSSLWNNEKILINIKNLLLLLIKIILNFLYNLICILIIYKLSPEYLICSHSIYYFIVELLATIVYLIKGEYKLYNYYDILSELFCIIGTIIYLELIELNFCKLNYNIKKNIEIRSKEELNISKLYDDENDYI